MPPYFQIKDCALVTISTGVSAQNLREFCQLLQKVPEESIYSHFYEGLLRFSFDDPEFRNDFAQWAKRALHDSVLAERLGIIDPHDYPTLEHLRDALVEIVEDRLYEIRYIPWARAGEEFYFLTSQTIVFDTGMQARTPRQLAQLIPKLSTSTIYYHFIEARRRLENKMDDFSFWIRSFGEEYQPLVESLSQVEYYFCSLSELKERLIKTFAPWRPGAIKKSRAKK